MTKKIISIFSIILIASNSFALRNSPLSQRISRHFVHFERKVYDDKYSIKKFEGFNAGRVAISARDIKIEFTSESVGHNVVILNLDRGFRFELGRISKEFARIVDFKNVALTPFESYHLTLPQMDDPEWITYLKKLSTIEILPKSIRVMPSGAVVLVFNFSSELAILRKKIDPNCRLDLFHITIARVTKIPLKNLNTRINQFARKYNDVSKILQRQFVSSVSVSEGVNHLYPKEIKKIPFGIESRIENVRFSYKVLKSY